MAEQRVPLKMIVFLLFVAVVHASGNDTTFVAALFQRLSCAAALIGLYEFRLLEEDV